MLFLVKRGDQYIPGFIPKGAGRGGCGGSLRELAGGAIWRLLRDCHRLELVELSSRGNRRDGCSAENREESCQWPLAQTPRGKPAAGDQWRRKIRATALKAR